MRPSRSIIEGWPTLMSREMAARYLSLGEGTFERLAISNKVYPVELECELLRWRKSDLDLLVKRLQTAPTRLGSQTSQDARKLDDAEVGRIAEALATRLQGGIVPTQPKLVSINEACTLLGIGRTTVYRLLKDAKLSKRQIGRRTLIPISELQSILEG